MTGNGVLHIRCGSDLRDGLAQAGIEKSTVTAFALTFLAYNFQWLWAPIIDVVKLPLIGRVGQRLSWLNVTVLVVSILILYLYGSSLNGGDSPGAIPRCTFSTNTI